MTATGTEARHLRQVKARAQLMPESKDLEAKTASMKSVIEGLGQAFDTVARNRGAAGPDKQGVEQVRKHWLIIERQLSQALSDGSWRAGEIRRVWIPKAGGGQRGLGIPNVVDRVVQEAIRQVLEPVFEPTFHPSSHGFRAQRSCHTAITEAKEYVREGREWVVDMDLENFFNAVNHQRLMSKLAMLVKDKALLRLIGQLLSKRPANTSCQV